MLAITPNEELLVKIRKSHLPVPIAYSVRSTPSSRYFAQELRLQDKLALLVLLARLVGLVVLPAHRVVALAACYIAHDVAAGGHVAFGGLAGRDVHHGSEEVGFAMLATEVLKGKREGKSA